MSLTFASVLAGLLLLTLGGLLLWNSPAVGATARAFPRSRRAAWLFFGTGSLWFLWIVAHLGEADLIIPRVPLFLIFAALAGLSFKYVPDFLAVRGLAVVLLLAAWQFLFAVYMNYQPQSYPLKIGAFLVVVIALFLAGYPYWLRDFFGWLFARPRRPRTVGTALAAYGLLLTVLAFAY